MAAKYHFLCEFDKQTYIYAIKSDSSDWFYFEEKDTNISVNSSLPANLKDQIISMNGLQEVPVHLDSEEVPKYITDGKFVFKGKQLRTYVEIVGIKHDSTKRKSSISSDDLVFNEGKSNPAVFLKEFERCHDIKTDRDKLFKIRNFAKPEHRPAFSKLFFENDWSTARSTFLKKYSLAFTANKKTALDVTFNAEFGLRSFVFNKMKAFNTYTRLSVEDQLEVILNELPVEVANLFVIHDKINSSKTEILEFCDTIQEILDDKGDEAEQNVTVTANSNEPNQVKQDLELCNLDSYLSVNDSSEVETSDLEKAASGTKRKSVKRVRSGFLGGPSKIKKVVCHNVKDDDNDDDEEEEDEYQSATSSSSNF